VPRFSAAQIGVFNRIAPPGTFLNVAPIRMSQLKAVSVSEDEEDQRVEIDLVSDSEDDLDRQDPSNIPAAPLSRGQLDSVPEGAKSNDTKPNDTKPKDTMAEVIPTPPRKVLAPSELMEFGSKVRRIQNVLPDAKRHAIVEALHTHGNEDDAIAALIDEPDAPQPRQHVVDLTASDDELASSPMKGIAQLKNAKVENTSKKVVTGHKSIAQKLGTLKNRKRSTSPVSDPSTPEFSGDASVEPVVKRRRLVRGIRPDPVPEPEADHSSYESSDEEVGPPEADDSLLDFLNTCDKRQLAELARASVETAAIIIAKRPFKSLDRIRKIRDPGEEMPAGKPASRKRPLGDKVVDASQKMWTGLAAIDRIVDECKRLGALVKGGMTDLNLTTNGFEIDATGVSKIDSGLGTPASSPPRARLAQPRKMSKECTLRDYQLVGLNWMNLIYSSGVSGILADDMGLGKTIQVIAFISHLVDTGVKGIHLIVVPGSTLENWVREFQRFSPKLNVYPYHGGQKERVEMRAMMKRQVRFINVVLTTYDMAQGKADNKFFRSMTLSTAVFDEGHMLKNKDSNRYKQLMKISSPWRLLLTGTPLQNNLQELMSILGFIMPTIFERNKEDLDIIFKQRPKDSVLQGSTDMLLSSQRVGRAREMMVPFILRRKKEQVVGHMPGKTCRVVYCDMTPRQKEVYDEYVQLHLEAMKKKDSEGEQMNHLMNSRKAAIHPLLFRYLYGDEVIEEMHTLVPKAGKFKGKQDITIHSEMFWMSDLQLHQLCGEYRSLSEYQLGDDEWMDSGKVAKLLEVLAANESEGSRTLVFSQFTTVMDILELVFQTAGIDFCRLDGSTPIADRQDLIDAFHEDESIKVFMLSTRAGGMGINLTCANKVVIFDSGFNPHDDIQAENRSHRLGQTRGVEVVRLVTRGTVEEKIYALGQNKLALDRLVSADGDKAAQEMGQRLVARMMMEERAVRAGSGGSGGSDDAADAGVEADGSDEE
jgi:SWI/SNF-related matrix-associated actin-dependent regulator 1 of chromatin subfamily A